MTNWRNRFEIYKILAYCLITFIPVILGIFWEKYLFSLLYFLFCFWAAFEDRQLFQTPEERKKELEDLLEKIRKRNAKKLVDDTYNLCLNRDRNQSFDDWVNTTIQLMAIDEVKRGETDESIVEELKELFGENNWEAFYPAKRVSQELSASESYWTALKKFDDQVAKDLKKKKL